MNKLIKAKDAKEERPFPKLMKSNNIYVYFKTIGVGQVVYVINSEIGNTKIGEIWECWTVDAFEDTDDQIVIGGKL